MLQALASPVEPTPPTHSPWGQPQQRSRLGPGVWSFSTASHGGIWLSSERNAQIPHYMRENAGWYEEDCCWSCAAVVHVDCFTKDDVATALKTLLVWMPDAYEAFTGQTVQPGESHVRDREVFYRAHPEAWVVCTAWGDWAEWVPKGQVGVVARQGRPGTPAYAASGERYFLVCRDEYRANRAAVGFVIDLERHSELCGAKRPIIH